MGTAILTHLKNTVEISDTARNKRILNNDAPDKDHTNSVTEQVTHKPWAWKMV